MTGARTDEVVFGCDERIEIGRRGGDGFGGVEVGSNSDGDVE